MTRSLPSRIKVARDTPGQGRSVSKDRQAQDDIPLIKLSFYPAGNEEPWTGFGHGWSMVRLTFYRDILTARKVEKELEGKEANQLQACCQ